MSRTRLFLLIGGALLLLLLLGGAGAWWYLFGANSVSAAELVPTDTVVFATIPNAAVIASGYESSKLKQLIDSPNSQPVVDGLVKTIGQKNVDLLNTFLPNLSGQSFIALTHIDVEHPEKIGFIAGMRPKAGMGDFNSFVDKLKATYPEEVKEGTTGNGTVAGVDYQWIMGPGAPDKICVAQFQGWIVTTWGEASLQDWIERLEKKSATSSLAQNPDYQKSLARVGKDPMTLLYINYHAIVDLIQKQMAKIDPAQKDYFTKKLGMIGGLTVGTRFENGDIVDRFSFLMPRQAQLDGGMGATACPFETLKFTGPDTRLYWASSINFQQIWKSMQEQTVPNPEMSVLLTYLQTWAQGAGLDLQKNIIAPLGGEVSVQSDWGADAMYPDLGVFVKLDKPDDFKPTATAIIEAVRKMCDKTGVIKELNSNGQNFATLQFIQASPVNPTITENGPYLALFLTPTQAVRAFTREESIGLVHNADFTRQIGDKRNGASQIIFMDSPQLLDRSYRTAMPYLSMAAMFNKTIGSYVNGRTWPPDLAWLAPMGTWACVTTPDDDGIQGYSVSGIGNQGILLVGGLSAGIGFTESMGLMPNLTPAAPAPVPIDPPPSTIGNPPKATPPSSSPPSAMPPPPPDATPTAAPAVPDANAAPTSAPAPNATSDAPSPTPAPTGTQ